jgi:hypothetical protein
MGKRSDQVKQKQPHGPPMTPGNMRDPAGVLPESRMPANRICLMSGPPALIKRLRRAWFRMMQSLGTVPTPTCLLGVVQGSEASDVKPFEHSGTISPVGGAMRGYGKSCDQQQDACAPLCDCVELSEAGRGRSEIGPSTRRCVEQSVASTRPTISPGFGVSTKPRQVRLIPDRRLACIGIRLEDARSWWPASRTMDGRAGGEGRGGPLLPRREPDASHRRVGLSIWQPRRDGPSRSPNGSG